MKQGKRFVCLLIAAMLAFACLSGFAEGTSPVQPLIERLVMTYAANGERDARALDELAAADPRMKKLRQLDKLVDELARGRPMEKILR